MGLFEYFQAAHVHQPAGFLGVDGFTPNFDFFTHKSLQVDDRRNKIDSLAESAFTNKMMGTFSV